MEREIIIIPPIVLEWSEWFAWDDLKIDARHSGGVKVPNREAGVYEARYADTEKRLAIARASNLRMRIKQGLVKGETPHSTGKRIRDNEEISRIVVRWAITERPAAVEEELHRRHQARFGQLPQYTKHT